LDSIEIQDNGGGISPDNYESVGTSIILLAENHCDLSDDFPALKHHTSKLSTYNDLESLQTFGFRGEALSSLCALSTFHIVTAREEDAPKGTRLDFEISGKLRGTQVTASQKGTTAIVEKLFNNLPVRRRELEKNIKREYGKVLGLLHAYACISTGVKFRVHNQMPKAKSSQVFHTNANLTTKENIANVYGAKTLTALIPLDLELEFEPSRTQRLSANEDRSGRKIVVKGHISRPVFGEGRQTPDRQMFFVNTRPCGLPQIVKAFNEVYKSFNVSQSPFIFADFKMDTNAYDVNVSPDKRTIALHDAGPLIESLKTSLMEMFENQEQTVPQSQLMAQKLPTFKQLTIPRDASTGSKGSSISIESTVPSAEDEDSEASDAENGPTEGAANDRDVQTKNLIHGLLKRKREVQKSGSSEGKSNSEPSEGKQKMAKKLEKLNESNEIVHALDDYDDAREIQEADAIAQGRPKSSAAVRHFNARLASQDAVRSARRQSLTETQESKEAETTETEVPIAALQTTPESSKLGVVQNAFDRMRPKRPSKLVATITIGDKTVTSEIGGSASKRAKLDWGESNPLPSQRESGQTSLSQAFGRKLKSFAAPGTQVDEVSGSEEDSEVAGRSHATDESEAETNDESQDASNDENNKVDASENEEEGNESGPGEDLESINGNESDEDYIDDAEKKREDEAKVQQLIREAEEKAARPTEDNAKRANSVLKGGIRKDVTTSLAATIDGSISRIEKQMIRLREDINRFSATNITEEEDGGLGLAQPEAEERLSLTVQKSDFASMRIIGQFNLGFILATRSTTAAPSTPSTGKDDLFIIDQHASDEKYNFERLQASTVVQNQRLVKPLTLTLTAVEEEIIIENLPALEKNGFLVEIDNSSAARTGRRCKLLSLPISKEVVFDTRDLEELVTLLGEAPAGDGEYVPRPTKVRKMFAMRACRSSVMIGKGLSGKRMGQIVEHMGEIDKPWNCPHGRPTMRHLVGLDKWGGWTEGGGLGVEEGDGGDERIGVWGEYVRGRS
jgi:DNA mismatch repair protein PMS2